MVTSSVAIAQTTCTPEANEQEVFLEHGLYVMRDRTFNQAASSNDGFFSQVDSFARLKVCSSWRPQIAFENILRDLLNKWRFKVRWGL